MRALGESKVLSLCFWCWSGKWGGEVSPRFPCVTSGVWELLLSLFIARWHNLVCLEFLQIIKLMVVGVCSIWGWCYSGWRCRTWEQFHSFREVKFLQGYSKTLWMGIENFITAPLSVELRVPNQGDSKSANSQSVVIAAGTQSGGARVRILWVANFRFLFYKICTQNQREHKSMKF